MTLLSVNINKVAVIRNSRGGNMPNLLKFAHNCEKFGADGITVHPRPDGRHIRYSDVYDLKSNISTELNVEGYPSPDFLEMVCDVKPGQVTLVPDAPEALTSNAGWNAVKYKSFLTDVVAQLKNSGIRTSIFVDTDLSNLEYANLTGTDRVELYTEGYADNYLRNKFDSVQAYIKASQYAQDLNLGVNAGHDLNLENLAYFHEQLPFLNEVSIGHALISDALYLGIENTIQLYKKQLSSL